MSKLPPWDPAQKEQFLLVMHNFIPGDVMPDQEQIPTCGELPVIVRGQPNRPGTGEHQGYEFWIVNRIHPDSAALASKPKNAVCYVMYAHLYFDTFEKGWGTISVYPPVTGTGLLWERKWLVESTTPTRRHEDE